jgi:hypothetical protein
MGTSTNMTIWNTKLLRFSCTWEQYIIYKSYRPYSKRLFPLFILKPIWISGNCSVIKLVSHIYLGKLPDLVSCWQRKLLWSLFRIHFKLTAHKTKIKESLFLIWFPEWSKTFDSRSEILVLPIFESKWYRVNSSICVWLNENGIVIRDFHSLLNEE